MTALANAVALAREHRRLERLMQCHQRALVNARFDCARRAWQRYRVRLATHIEAEEVWLTEAETRSWPLRWAVRMYRLEHRRICELARSITCALERSAAAADSSHFRIALIEREKTLKSVLEHHHAREEQDLYRHLVEALERTR